MTPYIVTWELSVDPDNISYQLTGGGFSTQAVLSGDKRAANFSLPSGQYHFEIFSTTNKVNSEHIAIDFTVP